MLEKIFSFREHNSAVYGLSPGRFPNTVFTASADRHVVEWDIEAWRQEPFVVTLESAAYSILYSPAFSLLFIGDSTGGLHVVDTEAMKEMHLFTTHSRGLYDFVIDEKRSHLLAAGGDGFISVWSLPDMKLVRHFALCDEKVRQLAINIEADTVAVACGDGYCRILDLDMFNEKNTFMAHEGGTTAIAWHPTKPALITGGKDARLRVWNTFDYNAKPIEIPAHHFAIYSIVFEPGGNLFATSSRDKTIKLWNASSLEMVQRLDAANDGHSHSVNRLLFRSGKLISVGDDRQIIGWG